MKIITTRKFLKKIIIILALLLSYFLFIDKPKALTSNYYAELKYNETTLSLKEQYQNEINLITEYININGIGGRKPNDNKYVIGYDLSTFNTTNKKIILIDISNINNYIESTYGPYRTSKNVRLNVSMAYQMFNINNGNVVTTSSVTTGNTFFYSYFGDYNCDPTQENCIMDTNNIYYDTSYINEQYSSSVINLRDTYINDSTYYFIPLKVGNIIHLTSAELNVKEFFDSINITPSIPSITYELIQQNGYYDLQLKATNYNFSTINNYDIVLKNMNNGNILQPPIQPTESGITEKMVQIYDPTTYLYYIEDKNTLEIIDQKVITIPTIKFSDFEISITNIDKENKSITYNYINNGNLTNIKCFHQISGQNEVEDQNCLNTTFTLNVGGNKTVNFKIYSNDILQFNTTLPFTFTQGQPYITFEEQFNGNITDLKVNLYRYNEQNYITKYIINNSTEIQAMPTLEQSTYNDKYSFTIWNLTNNSNIVVNIYDLNNNLISSSVYNYNEVKINQINKDNFDGIKGFFNRLNIDNISQELKNIVQNFGNIIMNSKIGNIIIIMATITILSYIVSLLRR